MMATADGNHVEATHEPAAPRRSRVRQVVGRLCVVALVVGLLVTAVAWLLPLRANADVGIYDAFATAAFFTRVFLIPMACGWLVLGLLAFVCRRRWVGVMSLLLAMAWAAPEMRAAWPSGDAGGGPTFLIASFNLNKDLRDATWAVELMRRTDADVVVVQEVTPHTAEQMRAGLASVYPHAEIHPDPGYDGMAVFSRTPLRLIAAPQDYESRNLDVAVTLLGREVRLVNVHLAPPQRAETRRSNRVQVSRLLREHADHAAPTIFVGDFNFTTFSPQGAQLRGTGFREAHLATGGGRQATWPTRNVKPPIPSVRIDTAYTRGGIEPVSGRVEQAFGSDHLPVVMKFRLSR
ncbi:MAG TPA: endonuclease/exonuclease/phosphatase family protein [Tepidisphaeraceae bacterium]|jgi:endonuclease/exonuclease/phosphatase (EEP) superfamily protein YafD